ncbi:MAG: protein-disulfide reductase DsbD N-terminal domain-containing protein [Bryobacteraceae bacterium]
MKIWPLTFAFLLLAGAMEAQNPVTWSLSNPPKKTLKPGEGLTLRLEASVESGWHLYALDQPDGGPISTEIGLAGGARFDLGPVRASKPVEIFDPNFNMRVRFYTDKASFQLPLKVKMDAPPGDTNVVVETRYQSCNDRICLPPKKVTVEVPVSISEKR